MPFYENVFIARQDVTAQQVDVLAETFTGIVTAQGGQVLKKEYWGLKGLTYRINKNRKGHYVLLNIEAPAGAIAEVERNMRLNEDVLRYLTVRVDELEAGPSAMLQSKGRDREGREGGREGRDGGREGGRGFGGGGRDRDDRLRPGRDGAPREGGFGGRDRGERPAAAAEGEGDRS
jgi:small subunit ribosomal protein S6